MIFSFNVGAQPRTNPSRFRNVYVIGYFRAFVKGDTLSDIDCLHPVNLCCILPLNIDILSGMRIVGVCTYICDDTRMFSDIQCLHLGNLCCILPLYK